MDESLAFVAPYLQNYASYRDVQYTIFHFPLDVGGLRRRFSQADIPKKKTRITLVTNFTNCEIRFEIWGWGCNITKKCPKILRFFTILATFRSEIC